MGRRKNKQPRHQQASTCRALVPIDGAPIRSKAFAEAAHRLKKIDRLEKMLDVFEKEELGLFNNWEQLTFQAERREIESLHSEHHRLARFHNWILAESEMKKISIPTAHHIMKAEEARYRNTSSAKVREEIELLRAKRDQHAERQMRREFEEQFQETLFGDDFFDGDDFFNDDNFFNDGDFFSDDDSPPLQKHETHLLKKLEGASDEKIKKLIRNRDECLELLTSLLGLTRFPEHLSTFLRVWDLAPRKRQIEFIRQLNLSHDNAPPFEMVVETMREAVEEQRQEANQKISQEDSQEGVQQTSEDEKIGALQRMKSLFRRLVQRLHPDYQGNTDFSKTEYWKKRLWLQIQEAHREQDHLSMEKLYLVHQLRTQQPEDMSVSEIQNGTALLDQDLDSLQREVRALKHSPAWGFSRKRSFTSLEKRLRRDYDKQRQSLQHEIEDLQAEHDQMEAIYLLEKKFQGLFEHPRKKNSSKSRKAKSRKAKSRKSEKTRDAKTKSSEQQASFF